MIIQSHYLISLSTGVSYFKKDKPQPLQTTGEIVEYDAENSETDNFHAPFYSPIPYGILSFSQLWGGEGAFWPAPQKTQLG